jgi:hypothetical protein
VRDPLSDKPLAFEDSALAEGVAKCSTTARGQILEDGGF